MKVEMALYILTQTMMHHMMRTMMVFQGEGTAGFFSLYVEQTLGVLTTAGRLRVTKSFTTAGQQCTKSGKYHTIDNRTCTIQAI